MEHPRNNTHHETHILDPDSVWIPPKSPVQSYPRIYRTDGKERHRETGGLQWMPLFLSIFQSDCAVDILPNP